MKKIILLFFLIASSIGLAACEDKKLDSDLIVVVFFTGLSTNVMDTLEIEKGSTLETLNDPVRLGYVFDGWFLDVLSTTPFSYETTINVSTTLFAKWLPNTNVITYEMDNGTNNVNNPESFLTGQNIIFSQPTRLDSTFIGWYLSPPSEINPMVDKRVVTTLNLAGDITLYAFFEGTNHVVTFNARGLGDFKIPDNINLINPRLIRITGGALIPELPTLAPIPGFVFSGWWNSDYTTQYLDGTPYTIARSATFFAKWEPAT